MMRVYLAIALAIPALAAPRHGDVRSPSHRGDVRNPNPQLGCRGPNQPPQVPWLPNITTRTPPTFDQRTTFLMKSYHHGIPHSYSVDDAYWRSAKYLDPQYHPVPLDSAVAIQDRVSTT